MNYFLFFICSPVYHSKIIVPLCGHLENKKIFFFKFYKKSVQLLSHVWLFVTPWTAACQASLSITNSRSLLKLMSNWVGDAIQPSHPLSSPSPPASIFPSINVFSNESALHIRWPKYWSFSFNISPSNKHSGLISFRMDWLDLLVGQRILKSLLQHYSSKASILQCSAFSRVQLSHPYMTTWLFQSLWLCGSQETVENSERDGNTRPPDLPLEKPVWRSGSNH